MPRMALTPCPLSHVVGEGGRDRDSWRCNAIPEGGAHVFCPPLNARGRGGEDVEIFGVPMRFSRDWSTKSVPLLSVPLLPCSLFSCSPVLLFSVLLFSCSLFSVLLFSCSPPLLLNPIVIIAHILIDLIKTEFFFFVASDVLFRIGVAVV
ncbi:MAG: hypothetical protein EI684_06250 [Candidatus Viridilinea halotolerans]|uniref:Uncharacterized protein n=1 Tax=Candidatus Viridilinea halotolerans TaxID=2491704 RepID=A0A426U4E0_9CHLR|nr:MAG: hypothetical protein EI684_06250 [Candidatus Viridilinea halotolerans]